MLLEILQCCLVRLLFGVLGGSTFLYLLLVLMTLLIGPTLSAFWLSGWLSGALYTGLLAVLILGLVVFLMLECSSL